MLDKAGKTIFQCFQPSGLRCRKADQALLPPQRPDAFENLVLCLPDRRLAAIVARADGRAAFERHVLEEVCHACLAVDFIERADLRGAPHSATCILDHGLAATLLTYALRSCGLVRMMLTTSDA